MKDPVRDLPRVLNSAMFIVATGFTLTVTALYIVLPMSMVREKDTPVVVRLTFLPPLTNIANLTPLTSYRPSATPSMVPPDS